jgi:hypothetical protein
MMHSNRYIIFAITAALISAAGIVFSLIVLQYVARRLTFPCQLGSYRFFSVMKIKSGKLYLHTSDEI